MARNWYLLLFSIAISMGFAQGQLTVDRLPADLQQKVDRMAEAALEQTGVLSASVAIVKDGQIVYTHAYGQARLDPAGAGRFRRW